MSAPELVLTRRAEIVHALCSGGSAEPLEQVLDLLLSGGQLQEEEHHSVQAPGRPLYACARMLLDLVSAKGADACALLCAALAQVLPEGQRGDFTVLGRGSSREEEEEEEEEEEDQQRTPTQTLVARRPGLVRALHGCVEDALRALVARGIFAPADCDDMRLPIHTPSQQARRLLDKVRSKGDAAAALVLQVVDQKQESGSLSWENVTPPTEVLRFQKKLRSSVSAQSCFLSSYGGTGHTALDDVYTEGRLEAAHGRRDARGPPLGPEDVAGSAGALNAEADAVLVSGAAGSGKSTLLQRMQQLWARGAALRGFLLLFPFSCRRLSEERRPLSVRELLFHHGCWPDGGQEEVFRFILDQPHRVLLTFDGLDELRRAAWDEPWLCSPAQRAPVAALLSGLLRGALLKGVRKVATSRPDAVGPALRRHLRKELLLRGFSPGGIERFVRRQHADPAVAAEVLRSLRSNGALLGLCHSPVFCWSVCRCHAELRRHGDGGPRTVTDVYVMVLQHFFRHRAPPSGAAAPGWLQQSLPAARRLGRLAFEGVGSGRYEFSAAQLEASGVTEEDVGVGFLSRSGGVASAHGARFQFLHVTTQCFFAALHVVLSDGAERSAIPALFRTRGPGAGCLRACLPAARRRGGGAPPPETPNLQLTATFVAGLLSPRHRGLWRRCCPGAAVERRARQVGRSLSKGVREHFRSVPPPVAGEKKSVHAMPGFLWLIKCIYELQESAVAAHAVGRLAAEHLKLTYCGVGPAECGALAYALRHLRRPVGLQLDDNCVGDVGVEQLLPCLHVCSSL
ncbi:Nucleotide-binding oligomerization domain-containing protein 2 [Liparis tanakae]|uniref:Nucleotide-binding oligomerization domain-containing protein 2 n=1 Tax=Liparis tanakae TaxID=230148 RepID=A0A4Z2FH74_9TELE|nr:Nucleotide-binding oligomerization domain-containing protein 2 [Liparis tanakae]